ncbi:MAG: sugar-transfer associated ATP-grasp domain-containing protein [Chromatocurvus sp.]
MDHKHKTKLLTQDYGIATPALLMTVKQQHELRRVGARLDSLSGFAIKPSRGSGGKANLHQNRPAEICAGGSCAAYTL